MRYGGTWKTGRQQGTPAITTPAPVRDRTQRLAAWEAFKVQRDELPAILATYKPTPQERAS